MKRRDFLVRSAYGLGAVWLSSHPFVSNLISQTLPRRFAASDTVTLGKTGIKTSRLAMGTGTITGCASLTLRIPMGVIRTWPRQFGSFRVTRSP